MKILYAFAALALAPSVIAQESHRIEGTLSLKEAVEAGMKWSNRLAASRSEVDAAKASANATRARQGLQISGNGFWTSSRNGAIVNSSPGVMPGASMMVPSRGSGIANIMAMLPIYTGGVVESAFRAARARAELAAGENLEMRGEVTLMIEDAYQMALLAARIEQANVDKVAASVEAVRTAQARLDAGKDIEASVMRAKAELAMAERELTMSRNDRAKALLDLKAAMGVDLESPISLVEGTDESPFTTLDEAIQHARKGRGLILSAKSDLNAANAEVQGADALLRPQVYGVAMGDAPSDRSMSGTTFGLTVSLPLFDSGERTAEARKMRAMRAVSQAKLREAELSVEKEVRQAWLDIETAKKNLSSAESAAAAATSAYEVVRTRLGAGKGILLEQLDALQIVSLARAEFARSRYTLSLSYARLRKATGSFGVAP